MSRETLPLIFACLQDAWNTKDPQKVSKAYTKGSKLLVLLVGASTCPQTRLYLIFRKQRGHACGFQQWLELDALIFCPSISLAIFVQTQHGEIVTNSST